MINNIHDESSVSHTLKYIVVKVCKSREKFILQKVEIPTLCWSTFLVLKFNFAKLWWTNANITTKFVNKYEMVCEISARMKLFVQDN